MKIEQYKTSLSRISLTIKKQTIGHGFQNPGNML